MARLLILWMKVGCVQGEMSSDARDRPPVGPPVGRPVGRPVAVVSNARWLDKENW